MGLSPEFLALVLDAEAVECGGSLVSVHVHFVEDAGVAKAGAFDDSSRRLPMTARYTTGTEAEGRGNSFRGHGATLRTGSDKQASDARSCRCRCGGSDQAAEFGSSPDTWWIGQRRSPAAEAGLPEAQRHDSDEHGQCQNCQEKKDSRHAQRHLQNPLHSDLPVSPSHTTGLAASGREERGEGRQGSASTTARRVLPHPGLLPTMPLSVRSIRPCRMPGTCRSQRASAWPSLRLAG